MTGGARHSDADLQRATEHLRSIQENAAGIVELAADADPGIDTWGAIGSVAFAPFVAAHLQDTYGHLSQMSTCLLDHVGAMDANRTFYQVQEDELTAAVEELGDAIDRI